MNTEGADRRVRDIVALTTLPAVWLGAEPLRVAESLLAAMDTTICADFCYVRLNVTGSEPPVEVAHVHTRKVPPSILDELAPNLQTWILSSDPGEVLEVRNTALGERLRVCAYPLGFDAEHGILIAGFTDDQCPTAFEKTLLNVAANQAYVACKNAKLRLEAAHQAHALHESEALYRQVAEGLPEIVWSAGRDGRLTFVNQRIQGYSGVPAEAVVDGGWRRLIHRRDLKGIAKTWRASASSGDKFEVELRLQNERGDYRWFLTRAIAIRSESGEITQWFGTCTDIHDQKATQHALQITNQFATNLASDLDLERIVQALCDASTSAIGADFGSFFYNVVNESGEAFLLYTLTGAPKEAFEKFGMPRATHLFGPTFRGEGIVRAEDIRNDPRYGQMAPHYGMPKGHLPVVSYLAVPVVSRSGEVIGGLFFGHKKPGVFTEEHERIVCSFAAQAAVAIDNARLYERVRSMNQELERMVQERTAHLLTANERLQAFTYHVSHDLRAPLRAIIGTSRLIQEDYRSKLPEEVYALLTRQADAAAKMGRLVDDLLKISRLSRQEMVLEPIDLTYLARDAAEEAMSTHPYSPVRIEVEEGLETRADPRLLRLALVNLIENAVKYSPGGGTVRVGARDETTFFVSDEGIGIEEAYLERIFEPFYRLHRDEDFKGTGIGLANVRQVVERHGGKVWAESCAGRGTTFYFTLESCDQAPRAPSPATTAP